MVDIFARLEKNAGGPIGQYMSYAHGYYAFPKLEGDIGPHMTFRGKKMLNWSLNNYLGLANHPEVRKADAEGAAQFGMAAPMGARMMSGQTVYHERLERELAEFVGKEDAFLLNFGYQGMISIIDCLLTPRDVVVYDAEAHACIIDGLRLHKGKRFVYGHNDMESLRLQLQHATDLAEEQNGGVLVITEGVFGMKGDLGKLDEIVALKKDFQFRLLVDDAHGFGTMGEGGRGTASYFGLEDKVDVYMGTFSKSLASLGGYMAASTEVAEYVRHASRPFIFSASIPPANCATALAALHELERRPELPERLRQLSIYARKGMTERGLTIRPSALEAPTPIIPIYTYETYRTLRVAADIYDRGVYVNPTLPPATPEGEALLRTSYMATHTEALLDEAMDIIGEVMAHE